MQDLKQTKNENFLEFADRLLTNRLDYDLDKIEIYELLYGNQVSSDHARKALTVLQMTIDEYKKDKIESKIEDNELPTNNKSSIDINKDGTQTSSRLIEMSEEQAKDSDYLLEKHGYSKLEFELTSARNSIWNSGDRTLYSSKVNVKPKVTTFDPLWIKEAIEELDLDSPVIDPIPYEVNGKTLEINIADAHINKLCAIDETGNEYSLDLGIQRLWQVIDHIIHNIQHLKIKKILFPFGQDCGNIDNIFKQTTKGTPQDTNVNYDVMYKVLLKNIIKIIYKLSEIAPVEVIYVGGNHDKLTSFTMTEAMYWHFLCNDNIEVDSVFNNRKYRLIGDVLLGLAHGSDEKKNIVYCMQNDVPELWGKSKYREFHLSHFHKEIAVDEKNGIIMRWISSISGTDAWTYNSGYVGSQKKAQSFVWDDKKGLEAIINSYV